MEVHQLPSNVIEKLRSGVSITGVTHCIQELVSNAIDAGATCIAVRLSLEYYKIQVVDNGEGIPYDQLNSIGERYHTSKCSSITDLNAIRSGGFRGEALASLRSVSSIMIIESRYKSSRETYCKVFNKDEAMKPQKSVVDRASKGTTVTVQGFLYNLPVRKQCILPALDFEECRKTLERFALMHPNISFSLRDDATSDICLETKKCGSLLDSFAFLFGREKSQHMKEVCFKTEKYELSGIIGLNSHNTKDLQLLYINKWFVNYCKVHKLVNSMLNQVLFTRHKSSVNNSPYNASNVNSPIKNQKYYGVFVLNISCPYDAFDMTFEPRKTGVLFAHENKVLNFIEEAIFEFFKTNNLVRDNASTDLQKSVIDIAGSSKGTFPANIGNDIDVTNVKQSLHSLPVRRLAKANKCFTNHSQERHCNEALSSTWCYVLDHLNDCSEPLLMKHHEDSDEIEAVDEPAINSSNSQQSNNLSPIFSSSRTDVHSCSKQLVNDSPIVMLPSVKHKSNELLSSEKCSMKYFDKLRQKRLTQSIPRLTQSLGIPETISSVSHKTPVAHSNQSFKKIQVSRFDFSEEPRLSCFKQQSGKRKTKSAHSVKLHKPKENGHHILQELKVDSLKPLSDSKKGKAISFHKSDGYEHGKHPSHVTNMNFAEPFQEQVHGADKYLSDSYKNNFLELIVNRNKQTGFGIFSTHRPDEVNGGKETIMKRDKTQLCPYSSPFFGKEFRNCAKETNDTSTSTTTLTYLKRKHSRSITLEHEVVSKSRKCSVRHIKKDFQGSEFDLNSQQNGKVSSMEVQPYKKEKTKRAPLDVALHYFGKESQCVSSGQISRSESHSSSANGKDRLLQWAAKHKIDLVENRVTEKAHSEQLVSCESSPVERQVTLSPHHIKSLSAKKKIVPSINELNKSNNISYVEEVWETASANKESSVEDIIVLNIESVQSCIQSKENDTHKSSQESLSLSNCSEGSPVLDLEEQSISRATQASPSSNTISDDANHSISEIKIQERPLFQSTNEACNSKESENNLQIHTCGLEMNVDTAVIPCAPLPANKKDDEKHTDLEINGDSAIIPCALLPANKKDDEKHTDEDANGNTMEATATLGRWQPKIDPVTEQVIFVDRLSGNSTFTLPVVSDQCLEKKNSKTHKSSHFFLSHDSSPFAPRSLSERTLRKRTAGQASVGPHLTDHFNREENLAVLVKWKGSHPSMPDSGIENMFANWENPIFQKSSLSKLEHTNNVESLPKQKDMFSILNMHQFTKRAFTHMKIIGQVDNKFIACIIRDVNDTYVDKQLLVLFDQHAVHERVRLEKSMEGLYEATDTSNSKCLKSFPVSPPISITLKPNAVRLLSSYQEQMLQFGIHIIQVEDSQQFEVHAIPLCLSNHVSNELKRTEGSSLSIIQNLIEEWLLLLEQTRSPSAILPKTIIKVLNSQACKGAVKFGDSLDKCECISLMKSLSLCNLPFQCAHGRPSIAPVLDIKTICTKRQKPKPKFWTLQSKVNAK